MDRDEITSRHGITAIVAGIIHATRLGKIADAVQEAAEIVDHTLRLGAGALSATANGLEGLAGLVGLHVGAADVALATLKRLVSDAPYGMYPEGTLDDLTGTVAAPFGVYGGGPMVGLPILSHGDFLAVSRMASALDLLDSPDVVRVFVARQWWALQGAPGSAPQLVKSDGAHNVNDTMSDLGQGQPVAVVDHSKSAGDGSDLAPIGG